MWRSKSLLQPIIKRRKHGSARRNTTRRGQKKKCGPQRTLFFSSFTPRLSLHCALLVAAVGHLLRSDIDGCAALCCPRADQAFETFSVRKQTQHKNAPGRSGVPLPLALAHVRAGTAVDFVAVQSRTQTRLPTRRMPLRVPHGLPRDCRAMRQSPSSRCWLHF